MTGLPFETYTEATAYFGIPVPRRFFEYLRTIDQFCQQRGYDTMDTLLDVFGILRIEGMDARYQQTPVELFPFAGTGSNGTHYGFVVHPLDEADHPSGELCPMDGDGVVVIGKHSKATFQELLWNPDSFEPYADLLTLLELRPEEARKERYDATGKCLRIRPAPKERWRFVDTADGAGIFADARYFAEAHAFDYQPLYPSRSRAHYEEVAEAMRRQGLYGSQLFYLKELYWWEWTDYTLARQYLAQMLPAYEQLNRPHLYAIAKEVLSSFDERYLAR